MRLEWLRLMALTAVRQRSRHRHFHFRFRPGPGGSLRARITPRRGAAAATVELRPGTSDRRVFQQMFLEDEFWLLDLARWPELETAPAPLLLDLGANIGLASLALHFQLPRARILAVEPDPANYAQLCRNAAAVTAIVPVHAAVAPRDGWVRIANPHGATAGFRTAPVAEGCPAAIAARSMESLCAGEPPLIVKMDIEGAERDLFSGDCAWLARTRLLIVEPHDWALPGQGISRGLLAALAARGGDIIVRGEHLLCWR
ncbi:MAG: FkbM family methyltransferase [Terriglobales bacterium]